jgi:hypothetical protein
MEYIITFIVAFWLGSKLSTIWNRIVFRDVLKDLGVTDKQIQKLAEERGLDYTDPTEEEGAEPELTSVEIKLEQHQGVIYAFRLDDDKFLGQGADREELIESLKKNLRDVRLIIAEEHGARLIKP